MAQRPLNTPAKTVAVCIRHECGMRLVSHVVLIPFRYVELLFKFDLGPVSQALVAYRQRMYATAAWQAICPPLPLLKRIRCERLCGKLAKNCPWLQTIAAGVKGDSNPLSEETDPDEQTERTRLTVDLCM
jgi:hypothetical protein